MQRRISAVDLKTCWKICETVSMDIVPHRVVLSGAERCFSLQRCQRSTKGYCHYTGWRNVKYFIIFCQPLWEPAPSGCFGGGIYRGCGINIDPTHWLENWDVFIMQFGVFERKRRGWVFLIRLPWPWTRWAGCGVLRLIPDLLSPTSGQHMDETLVQ